MSFKRKSYKVLEKLKMKLLTVLALIPALVFGDGSDSNEFGWLVGCWVTTDKNAQDELHGIRRTGRLNTILPDFLG